MSKYPIEEEYAHYITKQIEYYFQKIGYEVTPIPISRIDEIKKGYD